MPHHTSRRHLLTGATAFAALAATPAGAQAPQPDAAAIKTAMKTAAQ